MPPLELAPERMWNLSRWDQHTARRIVRRVLRALKARVLVSDNVASSEAWVAFRDGPWQLGAMRYANAGAIHVILAVRPLDERARWEDLPVLFRAFGMPERASPLVAFDDVPEGEPLYWAWKPDDPNARTAPSRSGVIPSPAVREFLAAAIADGYAAVRATRAAIEAAQRQADAELDEGLPVSDVRTFSMPALGALGLAVLAADADAGEGDMDNEGG